MKCWEIVSSQPGSQIYVKTPWERRDHDAEQTPWRRFKPCPSTPCEECEFNGGEYVQWAESYYQVREEGYRHSAPVHFDYELLFGARAPAIAQLPHIWRRMQFHQEPLGGTMVCFSFDVRDVDTDLRPRSVEVEITVPGDLPLPEEVEHLMASDAHYIRKREVLFDSWLALGQDFCLFVPKEYGLTVRAPGYYAVRDRLTLTPSDRGENRVITVRMARVETDVDINDSRPGESRGSISLR
jgi:hypothetical protein